MDKYVYNHNYRETHVAVSEEYPPDSFITTQTLDLGGGICQLTVTMNRDRDFKELQHKLKNWIGTFSQEVRVG